MVSAGAMVPTTEQYGAGAPAVDTVADVIVTPGRCRPVTSGQSITGRTVERAPRR
jgi:hypothetical protein